MADSIEVKGLKEARENLYKLSEEVGVAITRAALLAGALVISSAVKDSTYSTFTRRSGAIKAGFGVRVGKHPKENVLSAVVVQYPRAGTSGPRLKAVRDAENRRSIAYWWRFLEFGTTGRRAARTPKHLRQGRVARGVKQQRAEAAYNAARALGDLGPRPWVRPAFRGSVGDALDTFQRSITENVEKEVNKLPK